MLLNVIIMGSKFPLAYFDDLTIDTKILKEGLQRLLRICSAHNIGELHDLEIAQISHVLNFLEHKLYLLFI